MAILTEKVNQLLTNSFERKSEQGKIKPFSVLVYKIEFLAIEKE